MCPSFFFFHDSASTEIYTLSLHDALPICIARLPELDRERVVGLDSLLKLHDLRRQDSEDVVARPVTRSEEHTSELQSRQYLVCRLLLEKKKKQSSRPLNKSYNRTERSTAR